MVDPSNSSLPHSYMPLPSDGEPNGVAPVGRHQPKPIKVGLMITSGLMLTALLVSLLDYKGIQKAQNPTLPENWEEGLSRGKAQGVSEKANRLALKGHGILMYDWTDLQLSWQRTSFHFQPQKNWMNDPNGPMYYKGWYHLFYQYNPEGAVWGNIVWGHAVSKDLIRWRHLPIAMEADQWYDANGVWTGSATILPDGQVMMLYTGSTNESVQVQNLAYPANLSDPYLVEWVKYSGNPVMFPPPGIDSMDFRDPTTAWITSDGKWRLTIGSKLNTTGISLVYDTSDFKRYELKENILHAVAGTGMWECVDFYPVSTSESRGLDTSVKGPEVKHVVKISLDDDRNDYYAWGTYFEGNNSWVPDREGSDGGIGIRYDYGKFYASKTFYDEEKKRRILWGWVPEDDSEAADIKKGWASVQAIPRTVLYDQNTETKLIQWPVEEIESLRSKAKEFKNVEVSVGSVVSLEVENGNELDIVAEFAIDSEALEALPVSEEEYICSSSGGAAQRGALGPFGFLLLANQHSTEQTSVYFYLLKTSNASFIASFCTDLFRSSIATDVVKPIYGSAVSIFKGEKLSMRILVDHSIVEAFAQEGRMCITSRVYPTKAISRDAKLYLFNNATEANVSAAIKTWQITSSAPLLCSSIWIHHLLLFFSSFFLVARPSSF